MATSKSKDAAKKPSPAGTSVQSKGVALSESDLNAVTAGKSIGNVKYNDIVITKTVDKSTP
jgi:type VI protein secretion system component Hcp